MKIAICFGGLLSDAAKCYPYWKSNFFSALDEAGIEYDIFFHTYTHQESLKLDTFIDLYKPKKYIIEYNHRRHDNQKVHELLTFWNSAAKSCQLISQFINISEYNAFLRVRFDILPVSRFDVNEISSNGSRPSGMNNLLNMNDSCYRQGYYSDIFSLSTSYYQFMSLNNPYEFIKECFDKYHKNIDQTSSEKLYTDYILHNKIEIDEFSKLQIQRLDESGLKLLIPQTEELHK